MNVLKRIFGVIPTPVKAAAVAAVIATARLLSPESAEARPVPPDWTPQRVAVQQNNLHEQIFRNNNFSTAEEVALKLKDNMMRGEGVRIVTHLDVRSNRSGAIVGKTSHTSVTRTDGDFANWWANREGSDARRVNLAVANHGQERMFDIISENGTVRKEYHGSEYF